MDYFVFGLGLGFLLGFRSFSWMSRAFNERMKELRRNARC